MKKLEYTPEWLCYELEQALRPLTRKQRTTILRLAEARAIGRSWTKTFQRPEVCSETTWYGRYRKKGEPKEPGWGEHSVIQDALTLATERAQHWQDTRIARQIAKTQQQLAEHAPGAEISLYGLALGAKSESIKRLACLDILDRTGAGEVANKATVPPGDSGETVIRFELDSLPSEVLRGLAAGGEGLETGDEGDGEEQGDG